MGAYSEVSKCVAIDPTPGSICQVQHAPYRYIPTLWVGVLFTILFSAAFLAHLLLAIWPGRFKRGGFMILACICAAGEMAGWASRTTSHYDFFNRTPYLVQLICLIISPIFISAANYVTLERITVSVGTELARLNTKLYFILFISGDFLSLVIQAVGGGMSATADTSKGVRHGSGIALAGVVIQVLVTGPFLLLFIDFHWRHYRLWKQGGAQAQEERERWSKGILRVSCACFVGTIFILVRCVYRCREMKEGWVGYLSTHEPMFCIFDGAMITVAVWVFLFAHPGIYLPLPWTTRGPYLPTKRQMSYSPPPSKSSRTTSILRTPYRRGYSYTYGYAYEDFPENATTFVDGATQYHQASRHDSLTKKPYRVQSSHTYDSSHHSTAHKSDTMSDDDGLPRIVEGHEYTTGQKWDRRHLSNTAHPAYNAVSSRQEAIAYNVASAHYPLYYEHYVYD